VQCSTSINNTLLTHAVVDFRLLPSLSLLYLLASLDKANAGNAKLFGFLEDVGMTSNQFNLALTVLFFTYGLFEPICNVMLRRVGPKIWFPIAVTTWGLITTLTCVVKSYGGFIGIRLALGAAEATIYPGGYLLLSMWYKPKELATRMSIFYGANTAAGAFGGVIAYGVGNLDYVHGWRAWLTWNPLQIEGLITVLFGIMSYFMLPPFPQDYSANDRFSWLTPDEALYARLRTKYANGPHAPTYEFQWKDVIAAAKDRKTYFM
jgi:MFS family permease